MLTTFERDDFYITLNGMVRVFLCVLFSVCDFGGMQKSLNLCGVRAPHSLEYHRSSATRCYTQNAIVEKKATEVEGYYYYCILYTC